MKIEHICLQLKCLEQLACKTRKVSVQAFPNKFSPEEEHLVHLCLEKEAQALRKKSVQWGLNTHSNTLTITEK